MKTVWKRWPVGLSRESDNRVAGVSRPDCISFIKSSPGKPCDGVAWSVRTPWRRDRQVRSDWSFRSSATRRKDENNRSVLIHSVARPLPTSHSINTSPVTPHSRSSGALFWAAISTQLTSQVSVYLDSTLPTPLPPALVPRCQFSLFVNCLLEHDLLLFLRQLRAVTLSTDRHPIKHC